MKLMAVAEKSVTEEETIHNLPFHVDKKMIFDAIKFVDAYASFKKA